jgi:hemerythrin-like domain-containing protein
MSPTDTTDATMPADRMMAPHPTTAQHLVIEQTKVESQTLEYVTQALEVALAWFIDGNDVSRKLSTVRFLTESYQRHIERLFALEELDGYMDSVALLNPELTLRVADLKAEHEQFREAIRTALLQLDHAPTTDPKNFNAICTELGTVINQVLKHIRQENDLLVESVQQDTGGEG